MLVCQFRRFTKAHNAGNVFRAGALAALLCPAFDEVFQDNAFADIQRARAFGAVELMPRDGKKIDIHLVYINGHRAESLHGIGMKHNALFLAHRADLLNGLDGADFVVGKHDGNQDGLVRNGVFHLLRRYQAVFVYLKIRYLKALFFQRLAGMQNGVVFNGGGDDMVAFVFMLIGHAAQRPVIAFGGAGGEENFARRGADGVCHLLSGMVDGFFGLPGETVYAGGVAKMLGKIRRHGV